MFPTLNLFGPFGCSPSHQQTGRLISCGPDTKDLWRRAGGYADKILKGSKPADLPVEQPTKFDFDRLKTAKTLGLNIPANLLVRADEVIE